jgi:hypothetical protein
MEVPYSISLSAERTGLGDIFNQDDMNCMWWLVVNADGQIVGDYNTRLLIAGYWALSKGYGQISQGDHVFVSSWNARHNKYVEGAGVGLRVSSPLPSELGKLVYQSGDAKVYKVVASQAK